MRRLAVLALFLSSACSSSSPNREIPLTDCEALRDHFVEVSIETAAGVNPPSERITAELEKHRQNLKANYGADWLKRCQLESDPEWVSCSLTAHDKQALAACNADRPPPKGTP